MVVDDWHMVVNDRYMVRHEGLVVRATVVPQAREFDMMAWVAETADDCKDGDEDGNPKESWDDAEDAAPAM